MMTTAIRITALLSLCLFLPMPAALAQSTINFDSQGWSDEEIIGTSITINTYTFSSINRAQVPAAPYRQNLKVDNGASAGGLALVASGADNIPEDTLRIKYVTRFKFLSFYFAGNQCNDLIVIGYRNGKPVATHTVNSPGTNDTIVLPPDFGAVDQVDITSTYQFGLIVNFDDFKTTFPDALPVATITANDNAPFEEDGSIIVTVTRSSAATGNITVQLDYSGTATAGTDYIAVPSLIIPAGSTTGTATITLVDDDLDEDLETFQVRIASFSDNATDKGAPNGQTIQIVDGDPPPSLSIGGGHQGEAAASADGLLFSVALSRASGKTVTADYATRTDGTAAAGTDFTAASGTLTFAPGETTKTFLVPVIDDAVVEGDETIRVELSAPTNASVAGDGTGTGTIDNDDTATITMTDKSVDESDGVAMLTLLSDHAVAGGFTVDVSTLDGTATTADNDYMATSETVTFTGTPGETRTVSITITDDSREEADETLTVSLSHVVPGAAAPAAINISDAAVVTILNDDNAPVVDAGQTYTIADNAAAGTLIGTLTATDADTDALQDWTITAGNTSVDGDIAPPFVLDPATGTLRLQDAGDLTAGMATFTLSVTVTDGPNVSNAGTVTVQVIFVNDAPSFTKGTDKTVAEDSGEQTFVAWARDISAGPADEAGQAVEFTVSHDGPGDLFSKAPAISPDGTLTFTPAPDAYGSATVTLYLVDNGGTNNGGTDRSPEETFTITIEAVNDMPAFTPGATPVTGVEDAGRHTVTAWATNIRVGPANEAGQQAGFTAETDNTALFSEPPAVAPDGTLTFTPAPDAYGSASVDLYLTDNGGPGINRSATATFTITIDAVNDAPAFTPGADQSVPAGAASHTVAAWATAITPGPANESAQTLIFQVAADDATLFTTQPAIAANGTLTFTVAAGSTGTTGVHVTLTDNGGTAHGGDHTSDTFVFTITVDKQPQTITFAPVADKIAGQEPIELQAQGGNSGQPVTFSVTTDPPAGVASLVGNRLVLEGSGTVTVTASQAGTDTYLAAEDVTITFEILPGELFLPTLFTPNGDGTNDRLLIRGGAPVQVVRFSIFNRDGNEVFHSDSWDDLTANGWDGARQPQGAYLWVIKGQYADGSPLLINGRDSGVVRLAR